MKRFFGTRGGFGFIVYKRKPLDQLLQVFIIEIRRLTVASVPGTLRHLGFLIYDSQGIALLVIDRDAVI